MPLQTACASWCVSQKAKIGSSVNVRRCNLLTRVQSGMEVMTMCIPAAGLHSFVIPGMDVAHVLSTADEYSSIP